MAVGDIYRSEIFQNVGSELTMNVIHVRETVAEVSDPNLTAAMVTEMMVALYVALGDELSEDWRVIQISSRRVSPGSSIPDTTVFGGAEAIVGSIESEIIPSASAVLISLYTSNFTRSGRGRIYLPGLPESSQNEGQMVEARWTAMQTIANDSLEGEKGPFLGGEAKFRFCVFGGGAGSDPDQHVQDAQVRPNLATQKRRRAHPGFGG